MKKSGSNRDAMTVGVLILCMAGEGYPYVEDLKVLESRKPKSGSVSLPRELSEIRTPVLVDSWREALASHPDRAFRDYIVRGFREGFHIGFAHGSRQCVSAKSNMKSAVENKGVVEQYLKREVELKRVVGPLPPNSIPGMHINRFGVIPKAHQPGKWRLIVDLSHPEGSSVNDGIERELCSLHYTTVEEASRRVSSLGIGAEMAKFDLESAYRMVPVHPDDRRLLGMEWEGSWYMDAALPFGLRSAPKIFNAVADGLQYILGVDGVTCLHYLDDFFIWGRAGTDECSRDLDRALKCCARLGVPVAENKTTGPVTKLVFLGIEIDSVAKSLRLPDDKLHRLQENIREWQGRRTCTKRDLLSIIGLLQHACCVVRPGRSFLRRMITLATKAKRLHHRIRLNAGFRSDLCWWATFLAHWNGTGMLPDVSGREEVIVTSDASGSWGCGAFWSSGEWFQFQWPESWRGIHITSKELLPIVMASALWGKHWQGKAVKFRCDNAAVVAIVRSGTSKDELAAQLMRCLFLFMAKFDLCLRAVHLPGKDNGAADALSRNDHMSFLSQVPAARHAPTAIPPGLARALVHNRPDWMSKSWTGLLSSIS